MMSDELSQIIPNIYIGTLKASQTFQGLIVCVLEYDDLQIRDRAFRFPILKWQHDPPEVSMYWMENLVHFMINQSSLHKRKILVHCAQGIERSPLALSWAIYRIPRLRDQLDIVGSSFHDVYKEVRNRRPEAQDRTNWLPEWVRNGVLSQEEQAKIARKQAKIDEYRRKLLDL